MGKIKERIRELLLTLDYLFWQIFDISKFKVIKKEKIKRVLIIHSGAIGELLAATPVVRAIKEELNAEIHFMAKEGSSSILNNNNNIEKIIPYIGKFKEDLNSIKREKYDLALILWPGSLRITMICLLAGIKYRIGCFKMVKEGPAFFFTRRIFPLKFNGKHAVESNMMILGLIKIDDKDPKLEANPSKKAVKKVEEFLKKNKMKNFAIIHPGYGKFKEGKHVSRRWSEKRYAEVADQLIKRFSLKVLITGTQDEESLAKSIYDGAKNKKDIYVGTGKFDIDELLALLTKTKILIAPDTSIIHMASACETKVVDLMSRSPPSQWRPWMKSDNYRVLYHPANERGDPCDDEDQSCILAITTEEVMKAISELLE